MAKDEKKVEMPEPEPWEPQEGESARAYEAFCVYRDLGPKRSIREVCGILDKSRQHLGSWSSEFDWVKRAAAWDAEQDRIARIAQIEEIKEMRKRHASIAMRALTKVSEALENIDPEEMSNSDIARLMDVSSKLERLSRGDTSEVLENRDGGQAINPVQIYLPDNGRGRDQDSFDDLEV